ncbi:formyltransferase family protein [Cohnella silvisoli]|uniref:Formyltransferase family protein n=1 Tax=Cohnella silvisoli TaxID=2873699 RepID=A0ABV1KVZ4_9BACL|nr:formyltransferase family protein [Cohnella silvisoli]MCD9023662.1 methionyl-tRNA formyltransferase [Cohnella silvisoli]
MLKKITVVSDRKNWINDFIPKWLYSLKKYAEEIVWTHDVKDLTSGDIAFFLGCEQIVPPALLALNSHNLVVHASDLPKGKGWSPLTWKILQGDNEIPVVLFEAADKVDNGPIYLREKLVFQGTELIGEMRMELGRKSIALCNQFLEQYPGVLAQAEPQQGESSYYPRRTPEDSRLDPDRSIREQFQLMRVADNARYPCYFELNGCTFEVKVEKRR